MKTATLQHRQTLWDIAIEHCGSADAAFGIATLNGLAPTTQPAPGTSLDLPEPHNTKTARHYAERHTVPATAPQDSSAPAFAWSDAVCAQQPLWFSFAWSETVCAEAEVWNHAWSGNVCATEAGPWNFAWGDTFCALANDQYGFRWSGNVCATDPDAAYAYAWSGNVCSQRYTFELNWEEM